ncbi:recombinase RecF (plasmid) [Acidihalobacter aeolianus]|uniref:Recombinase RecF n=1 Tax=Acidihalobacter aeolianus TaxID=2792603 RepID=A0A1D8KCR1_9GAMM|nr:AAA family ATPase [Acidihalobacter aeolianus]AOV18745.1 recombinase RecF [Acidihalobacter aeolianus]
MLKRIKISGYKSLRNVEVELQPLSVLFGPNGAGKSNFLDALQLLSKLATSRTLKDAFEPPYRGKPLESFSFGPEGIKGLLNSERATFSIEVDVELSPAIIDAVNQQIREMKRTSPEDDESNVSSSKKLAKVTEKSLRYRIEVEILPKSGLLRVSDEYLTALNRKGEPTDKRKPFLERVEKRLHLRMEGQAHPTYYERYLDHSILSLPNYPPHYPHLVAMRRELESWFFFYFEPRERMRAAGPVKEVRHIGLMGEELAGFLNTLKAVDTPQFRALEKALRTILPNVEGIDVEVDELGEVELKLRENGIPVPARLLSEGTLRVLGLLALAGAKEQPSLIGFEEPENGIHPRRIQLVAELLKTRASLGETQYIVTTHSPLLPDLMSDDSLFVCKRSSEGETTIEPFSVWGPLGKKAEVDSSLMEEGEEGLTVSERLLRGDFDA